MRLSTKVRYGARAMVDICMQGEGATVMSKDIAKRQGLSKKYLDALLRELKNSGLLRSQRGAGGGFVLAKDPNEITMEDVVAALEGDLALTDCVQQASVCQGTDCCATYLLWKEVSDQISNTLSSLSLAEMAERQTNLNKECEDGIQKSIETKDS